MTYKEWEKKLLKYLNPLSSEERMAAVEYYREMYGDKLETGASHEKILQEFGEPSACAERILNENGFSLPKPKQTNNSVAWWAGIILLTLIIIIPIYSALFSVVVVFAAMVIASAAIALAGVIYAIYSPFMAIDGVGLSAIIAHMGMGIAAIGVGLLLFVAFIYLTKYSYKWLAKSLVFIYKRRTVK